MRQKKLVYYGKKCLIFLISVFILSVAVFYVARLAPGDPLISYYGDRTEKMSPEEREWAMEKLGLNEPISVQYVKWVKNAFHGEFGISFKYKQDVLEVIGGRIGNTLLLGGIGFVIMFAGALLLGILCAWYENRLADRILCKLGTISSCIPGILDGVGADPYLLCKSQDPAKQWRIQYRKGRRCRRQVDSSDHAFDDRSSGASVVLCLHDPK